MAFLPSAFQCLYLWKIPLHFLAIWSKLYPVWKCEKEGWVRKTQILTNFKATNCYEATPIEKLIYFLPTHANWEKFWPVWKFGLCNRGQLGRICTLTLYPLIPECQKTLVKLNWCWPAAAETYAKVVSWYCCFFHHIRRHDVNIQAFENMSVISWSFLCDWSKNG